MMELNLTGPTEKVKAVLALVQHTVVEVWKKDDVYDLNVKVEEELVDDMYEACDQAGVEIKMV